MDLDKAISMIPVCTGEKDVAEFINICEIALKDISEADKPILLKIITSKLTGNTLEVTKYNNLEKISERALSIGLKYMARIAEGESVVKFAARIEELYYKLCAASTIGLSKAETQIVKNQTKKQAMIIFITGLPHHLYTVLNGRNPDTLEQCFKLATDEELEYNSKLEMEKLQGNIQIQNISNEKQAGGSNAEKQNVDSNKNQVFNRGGNGIAYQRIIGIIILIILMCIITGTEILVPGEIIIIIVIAASIIILIVADTVILIIESDTITMVIGTILIMVIIISKIIIQMEVTPDVTHAERPVILQKIAGNRTVVQTVARTKNAYDNIVTLVIRIYIAVIVIR
ncbi:uncharacterized protein LOC107882588 [Acyrthosiphon pisum]|uniref:Uncharacterized protein n=1 Tax=Acyrthosiphon pisum TaxID=7029 RepID=A0A8R2D1E7_ACYPI|nr:uncharacterized protein LOC107882588 [Acyrthosiphon pisum]|eukprot:XP_016656657.1 PREDICTED: uncharacterized protein LOC107882588 [Acyrthosiphon pisum]